MILLGPKTVDYSCKQLLQENKETYNGEKDFFITTLAIATVCGGIGANIGPTHLNLFEIIAIVIAAASFPILGPSIAGAIACALGAALSHASMGWILGCGVIGAVLGYIASLVSFALAAG